MRQRPKESISETQSRNTYSDAYSGYVPSKPSGRASNQLSAQLPDKSGYRRCGFLDISTCTVTALTRH